MMSSVKFHPGWAGKLEQQWQQQSCWLVLTARRVQQKGDDGLWSWGGCRGLTEGRTWGACGGVAGGCGEDECVRA